MRNYLKKCFKVTSCLTVGVFLFSITSCSNEELTKRNAEKALEQQVMFQDSSQYVNFPIGYFELNDAESRFLFRKLAAAGMITYDMKIVNEKVRKTVGYDFWSGYSYAFVDEPHYFVNVAFTDKGKKFVIDKPITEIEDKDLVCKEDKKEYPEDKVTPEKDETAKDVEEDSAIKPTEDNATVDADNKSPYDLAKEKINIKEYPVLTHYNEIVKIRDIFSPEEMQKNGRGVCSYIYEYKDVTPFGRIIKEIKEGTKKLESAQLIRYNDNGWRIANLKDE